MLDTQNQVAQGIQQILDNGASILYNAYLRQKLAPHTHEQTQPMFYRTCETLIDNNPDSVNKINKISHPQSKAFDTLIEKKIKMIPPNTITIKFSKSTTRKTNIKEKGKLFKKTQSQIKNNRIKSSDNIRIKSPFVSLASFKTISSAKDAEMLKNLFIRRNKQKIQKKQSEELEMEKQRKIIDSIDHFNRVKKQGPINYNYEGKVFSSAHKNISKNRNFHEDLLEMKYQTSERCIQNQSKFSEQTKLTGRKRGYTSQQRKRPRHKMTNSQFNNKNMRQVSTIPFLTIQPGVKVTQKQKNVFAEKTIEILTKDIFDQQTDAIRFRSYISLNPDIMRATISSMGERKLNSDHQSTFNSLSMNKTTSMFRTKTAKHKQGKIIINNQDLAENMCLSPEKLG